MARPRIDVGPARASYLLALNACESSHVTPGSPRSGARPMGRASAPLQVSSKTGSLVRRKMSSRACPCPLVGGGIVALRWRVAATITIFCPALCHTNVSLVETNQRSPAAPFWLVSHLGSVRCSPPQTETCHPGFRTRHALRSMLSQPPPEDNGPVRCSDENEHPVRHASA